MKRCLVLVVVYYTTLVLCSSAGEDNPFVKEPARKDFIWVTGEFTQVTENGATANNVAMWDIVKGVWWFLRDERYDSSRGLNGGINAISSSSIAGDDDYFLGGEFNNLGHMQSSPVSVEGFNLVARWNASLYHFEPLGQGLEGERVDSVLVSDMSFLVFFSGKFDYAIGQNSTKLNNIAGWNRKTSKWFPLGQGFKCQGYYLPVKKMAMNSRGLLYALSVSVADDVGCIGTYDYIKDTWENFEFSIDGSINDMVIDTTDDSDVLYIGGSFTKINDQDVQAVAMLNATTNGTIHINPVGSTLQKYQNNDIVVYTILALKKNVFYIGGTFNVTGSFRNTGSNVARLTEHGTFEPVGKGVYGPDDACVSSLSVGSGDFEKTRLFIGGRFDKAGDLDSQNLAQYEIDDVSGSYIPVLNGTYGPVTGLFAKEAPTPPFLEFWTPLIIGLIIADAGVLIVLLLLMILSYLQMKNILKDEYLLMPLN